ncbi:chromosome segregation protein SMC [Algicella marina]|uniref:Chromosome partition protein Smc n=1 Tax=Algicella marina TaxID=2683284 RepID=A0A6P1T301_9RHOB|nr:chromosome segregation protein SMC [Algicella marina]QHQ36043.1 chromosome segregation protein SMC [Algicella marina]
MHFTRIRLQGFKSFVDQTELSIAPGLTGVVGPNGCGKSNLLEALRWVMGENRPTAMRGGGMEDVIFAGASSRPARNFAEVTLQLDNSDRLAPPGFNDSDVLEIVRRITRDVGSAYKTNGKDARARDVQMLFADASTGAHSPALVRQGQIAELINAKPKARRRILEEAAGISGLYQRRHEAELKLRGAETNLARVEDVTESLQSQLNSLARQAKQAARYREIAGDLRRMEAMLLYRRWKEADEARAAAAATLREAIKQAAQAQGSASEKARARAEAEGKLPPLREEEAIAGAVLQRLLVERDTLDEQDKRAKETIATLESRIEQLARDSERETGLNRDAGEVIAKLTWEKEALEKASEGQDEAVDAARAAAQEAGESLQSAEAALDSATQDAARLSARHQAAERRREEAEKQLARLTEAVTKAETAMAEIAAEIAAADARNKEAIQALATAQETAEAAEASLLTAETGRTDAQAREGEVRAVLAEAEGIETTLNAEISALERLLDRERGDGPQLLDAVRAEAGFEPALGAALGDDLKAPLVDDSEGSGWVTLPGYSHDNDLPAGVSPLTAHVTAPDALARRLGQIGLVDASEGARYQPDLQPGQRLVSREGDVWRWDGYRASAEDAPSAAALRLQQINRLDTLKKSGAEAKAKADVARQDYAARKAALEEAQMAEKAAREARRQADAALTEATRRAGRTEGDLGTLQGRQETLQLSLKARQEDSAAAKAVLAEAVDGLIAGDDLGKAREVVEGHKVTVEAARLAMIAKRTRADELRREGEARTKRRQEIIKEVSGWQHRLNSAQTRIAEFEKRSAESQEALKEARKTPDELASKRAELGHGIEKAETRKKAAGDALAAGETARREAEQAERDAERSAGEARENRARAEALEEAAEARVSDAEERIAEEMDAAPQDLLEQIKVDPDAMPSSDEIENEVLKLRRQRDALGAVNLRAEEDARSVQEEFDTLTTEKSDLEQAIGKLRSGIANLNREGRQRLLDAFEQVNTNFSMLFKTLFGGGDANLVLVESDDPLEAGLEIMCQPPGKKLATLSLLSGGEQTLTAMSLIFAVFLANPSPICVLDEVDAPLDDANVTRFCDLLDEMIQQTDTRFLIITHHAVTMSRMDRLFGVTMAEQGVSQLVSVDLRQAEKLVDA